MKSSPKHVIVMSSTMLPRGGECLTVNAVVGPTGGEADEQMGERVSYCVIPVCGREAQARAAGEERGGARY